MIIRNLAMANQALEPGQSKPPSTEQRFDSDMRWHQRTDRGDGIANIGIGATSTGSGKREISPYGVGTAC